MADADGKTVSLTGPLAQTRGVIGRYPEAGQEYVFEFDSVRQRTIHMAGVRKPLRVEWYVGEELQAAETLAPWVGWGRHRADRVVERRP